MNGGDIRDFIGPHGGGTVVEVWGELGLNLVWL